MGTYWSWSLLRKGRSCYTLDKEWNTRKEKKLFVSSRIYRWAAWKAFSGRQKEKKKTRHWPIPHFHGHQTLPMWMLRARRESVIIRSKKNKVSCAHVQSKQQLAQSTELRLLKAKACLSCWVYKIQGSPVSCQAVGREKEWNGFKRKRAVLETS